MDPSALQRIQGSHRVIVKQILLNENLMFYLLRSFKMSPVSWKLYCRGITAEILLETKRDVSVLCCVRLLDLGWIFTRWANWGFRIAWSLSSCFTQPILSNVFSVCKDFTFGLNCTQKCPCQRNTTIRYWTYLIFIFA